MTIESTAQGRPAHHSRVDEIAASFALLKRGASGAFIVQVTGAGLGLLSHFAIARLIGQADYGVYALALSWVSVLAVVAQLGQDTAVVRFLPGYCLKGEWDKARGLRRGVGVLVLCASTAIALAGCAVIHAHAGEHAPDWSRTFYVAFAMLPALTQLQQSGALHRAFKHAISSGLYINVARPVLLIALLATAVYFGHAHVTAFTAMLASAFAALLALAISAWHLSRSWPVPISAWRPAYELRRWAVVGAHLSLLSIVIVAGNRLDVLLLGALTGTDQVGAYYAAAQIAAFVLYGLQATNVILAPLIAERYDAGDLSGLQTIARRAAWLALAAALAVSLFFAITGHWILGLFGKGFTSAYVPLLILLCGYIATTALGEVGFMLSMTRYQRPAMLFVAIGILANSGAAWLLVPRWGALGAAIGSVLSLLTWRSLALWFVIRRLGVNPSVFGGIALRGHR